MTYRSYLTHPKVHLKEFSYAVDDGPIETTTDPLSDADLMSDLRDAFASDDWRIVAYNMAFELRVFKYLMHLPPPRHALCAMEMAMCAWPCQQKPAVGAVAGGPYSLGNIVQSLGIGEKMVIDLATETDPDVRRAYVEQDVHLLREVYHMALPKVPECEQAIGELCNRTRDLTFHIDPARAADALTSFRTQTDEHVAAAVEALAGDDLELRALAEAAFGWEGGRVKSVNPIKMRDLVEEVFGFNAGTISLKKIAPGKLTPDVHEALTEVGSTNKTLWNVRNTAKIADLEEVDAELGWFRAHTGRFSSACGAKGLNLHNIPKHAKEIAKPLRSLIRLPSDVCWVRGDAKNVEYRMGAGYLAQCEAVLEMFRDDPFADPYLGFGRLATGIVYDDDDPIRQIWKMAVLGLNFKMGENRFTSVLAGQVAAGKVTLEELRRLASDNHWRNPSKGSLTAHCRKIGCEMIVGVVAYHVRKQFWVIHAELDKLIGWLEKTVTRVSSALDPDDAINRMYDLPYAPDRDRIDLRMAPDLEGRSIRVRLGHWCPTLVWRDIAVRETPFGMGLTNIARFGPRALTPQVLIENAAQAVSRNALCEAKLALADRYPHMLSIHDELLLLTRRDRKSIQDAALALVDVAGPGNSLGYGNMFMIDPNEVTVSESMWEEPFDFDADEYHLDTLP